MIRLPDMFGFRKARAALRLDAANRAFAKAYAARIAAEGGAVTQIIGHTRAALRKARTEQVAAELNYAAFTVRHASPAGQSHRRANPLREA